MKNPLFPQLCLVGLLAVARSSMAGAVVEGTVNLAQAAKAAAAALANARYQVKTTAPIGTADPVAAVVYLEGSFPAPSTNEVARMGQRHFQFAPGLLAVRKGATIEFPNLDDDYHSVFSYSKLKRFDLGRYRKEDKPALQVFDQAGVIKLYCEIHEHMRGTIVVLDTPHFVKTAKDGKYRLENLPAGEFKLKAWLDEKIVWERAVNLKDGETLTVNFEGK